MVGGLTKMDAVMIARMAVTAVIEDHRQLDGGPTRSEVFQCHARMHQPCTSGPMLA